MKKARDQKPVRTMPEGVYEGGLPEPPLTQDAARKNEEIAEDFQGNGYPLPTPRQGKWRTER